MAAEKEEPVGQLQASCRCPKKMLVVAGILVLEPLVYLGRVSRFLRACRPPKSRGIVRLRRQRTPGGRAGRPETPSQVRTSNVYLSLMGVSDCFTHMSHMRLKFSGFCSLHLATFCLHLVFGWGNRSMATRFLRESKGLVFFLSF